MFSHLSFWQTNRLKAFSAPKKLSSSRISTALIQLGLKSRAIWQKKNMSELDKTVKNTEGTPASFLSPSQHCIIYEKEGADSKTSAGIETQSISTSTRAVEFLNSLEEIHILKNENNYNTLRHWFCLCRFASGCILWAAWSDQQPHKHRSASI